MKNLLHCSVVLLLLLAGIVSPSNTWAQGSAFTYQGRLNDHGNPAGGTYDLTFAVWNLNSGGTLQAGPLTNAAVAVSNGIFTVTLDFGAAVFNGQSRWLEIGVRTNGGGAFSVLAPRQPCTAAPYAITAASAGTATTAASVTGSVAAGQITGTLAAGNIGAGTITAADLAANAAAANLNAAGQSGVASSGLVLSTTANNTNLATAGYVKIYGSFGTPDAWQAFTNAPGPGAPSARNSHTAVWTGAEMIIWGGFGASYLNDGGRYNPAVDSWTALPVTETTPAGRLNHTAVWTGSEMIVWGGVGGTNSFNDGGLYDPVLNVWTYLANNLPNTPSGRLRHTAVWTGTAMIVWGGTGTGGALNDGGIYNPGLNSWTYLPNTLANTPVARSYHTTVWTGTEMIVWGGAGASGNLNDGSRYNPASNSWTYIPNSLAGTPLARQTHTAVWTGTEMIVWGGAGNAGDLNDGGRYNPASNAWTPILNSLANTPAARDTHTAVWTGSQMIVWGGYGGGSASLLNDGGRYSPSLNSWTYITNNLPNTPAARYESTAVWTGTEMIVWGGAGLNNRLNDGGRYNPASNSWLYLPNAVMNTPSPRALHTAVWTGAEMIVWGGTDGNSYFNDGGRFNPALNSWIYLPNTLSNTPAARAFHTVVWTGTEMVVWGGLNNSGFLNDGGRFNPASGIWTAMPGTAANVPAARNGQTAVWTGTEMIVWGGIGVTGDFNDGGRFNPALNSWTYVPGTLANTPEARTSHTAVWSGTEMIVWGGGSNATCYADGGRYNPASNLWIALPNSLGNTPGARSAHTAVWTGAAMIVWGGAGCGNAGALNDGGLYSPASNSWTYLPNTLANTPAARDAHTAVWTGIEMVVWGGSNNATAYSDGGRYDPALNSWTYIPNTLANTPAVRANHTAVWTGGQMLVWGGTGASYYNDASGFTPGRALYLYQRP